MLNEAEKRAMRAICWDCDDIDGYGFTRPADMILAVMAEFDNDGQVAGGYIRDLIEKSLINMTDDEVWVEPDVFAEFI